MNTNLKQQPSFEQRAIQQKKDNLHIIADAAMWISENLHDMDSARSSHAFDEYKRLNRCIDDFWRAYEDITEEIAKVEADIEREERE